MRLCCRGGGWLRCGLTSLRLWRACLIRLEVSRSMVLSLVWAGLWIPCWRYLCCLWGHNFVPKVFDIDTRGSCTVAPLEILRNAFIDKP